MTSLGPPLVNVFAFVALRYKITNSHPAIGLILYTGVHLYPVAIDFEIKY